MLLKTLSLSLALLSLLACNEKDSKRDDETQNRPEIPLNAPTDILGTWIQCTNTGAASSSAGIYAFAADGKLDFKSVVYQTVDCQGEGTQQLAMSGSYVAGAGNSLDMTLGEGKAANTVYRVFSVQGERLLISNNVGAGADIEHRDYDLNANAQILTKIAL